jgi:tRNA(adenine34) deaminase
MRAALAQAEAASLAGEVPVGAVVVHHNTVIGAGHNTPIGAHDPTAHAEIAALREAAGYLGNYRLDECELFVTLEPCAMCAGAMLHARLKRVVYGAVDSKTGATGSVINVFAVPQLNHHTQVQGGVLAEACSELLQEFFKRQRLQHRQEKAQAGRALRDDALRTPESRFATLPNLPAPSFYVSDLPSLAGLRMHYLDTGGWDTPETWLFLHGPQDWSYAWRSHFEADTYSGKRLVCPDLIGFGKSDKPKKVSFHTVQWHAQVLLELINRLGLSHLTLVLPDHTGALALHLLTEARQTFANVCTVRSDAMSLEARHAPFPDDGHRAALKAFSAMDVASAGNKTEKTTQ